MADDERHARTRAERFAALFEAHYPRILGYARRRASDEDAADIAAETFSVAWRRFEDVPAGDAALLWLYGSARRVLWNLRRSQERQQRLGDRARTQGADAAVDALEYVFGDTAHPHVAMVFSRLGPDDQELLGLMAWEELTVAEIAATLGCSRNAARIRIHRARRRFAYELERLDGQADGSPDSSGRISPSPRVERLELERN